MYGRAYKAKEKRKLTKYVHNRSNGQIQQNEKVDRKCVPKLDAVMLCGWFGRRRLNKSTIVSFVSEML